MFFFGITCCMGNNSADAMPSNISTITEVRVTNCIIDGVYMTKDTTSETSFTLPSISEWTFDTIFNAPLNGNLLAGNANFTADEISKIRIKRADHNSYNWMTLFEVPVETNKDLNFTRIDRTARGGNHQYKYALVPVWNNNIEGNYNVNTVESSFDGLWIVEKDASVNALLNFGISTQQNINTSVITTIGRKYPFVNRYGKANYSSGKFDATFIHFNNIINDLDLENAVRYREQIEEFFTNGQPKLLKHFDGRIWLAAITDVIPKDESSDYRNPIQSISYTAIGDPNSQIDLYKANIIDYIEEGAKTE